MACSAREIWASVSPIRPSISACSRSQLQKTCARLQALLDQGATIASSSLMIAARFVAASCLEAQRRDLPSGLSLALLDHFDPGQLEPAAGVEDLDLPGHYLRQRGSVRAADRRLPGTRCFRCPRAPPPDAPPAPARPRAASEASGRRREPWCRRAGSMAARRPPRRRRSPGCARLCRPPDAGWSCGSNSASMAPPAMAALSSGAYAAHKPKPMMNTPTTANALAPRRRRRRNGVPDGDGRTSARSCATVRLGPLMTQPSRHPPR